MNFQPLIDDLVNDFKGSGAGLWDKFTLEQRPVVEMAVRRIGELTAKKLTDPANVNIYDQDLAHNYNTLLSQTALAQAQSEQAFYDFLGRAITKLTSFALALA